MNNEVLRDYQQEMLGRLRDAWRQSRSVMVQMPTGTGKTHLMAAVIRETVGTGECRDAGNSVLIVAHRVELITQIRETLRRFGIDEERDGVHVESIQKLSRRLCHTESAERSGHAESAESFSLVVVDEAHHALAKTYRMLWDRWPEARFLGLTATPCRLNGAPFTDLFDRLLQSWSIQEFIDKDWLSDFEYVSAAPDSVSMRQVALLNKRGADGDYQVKQMATVMDVPESVAHLYETYREFAEGKKGIVYAIDRLHAQHIAEYYQGHGVRCAVIDAKTPAEERREIVERYKGHTDSTDYTDIDVIVNVDIFSEGFDCPEVEFIQLARPTLSLCKYLQQVGRGMRVSDGKEAVTILDNVGLYQTFGLPTDERDWRLMFAGKAAGKGVHGESQRPVIIRDDAGEKTLVNLEMVRIKGRKEKHEGVEVFMVGGKYGIMVDGKETCRAEYEHIHRIHNGSYFAIATYPYTVFKGKSTVISLKGQDMRASLYGKVTPRGDFVEGETISGQRTYWDSKGLRYYSSQPVFETVGGVEMVCRDGKYILRQQTSCQREPVGKEDIWYNREILWMKDVIVFKRTGVVLPIAAYGIGCFFVTSNDQSKGRYLKVLLSGKVADESISYLGWQYTAREPRWGSAKLVRASTGMMEYMDQAKRQINKI